jgi:hypothetical protein
MDSERVASFEKILKLSKSTTTKLPQCITDLIASVAFDYVRSRNALTPQKLLDSAFGFEDISLKQDRSTLANQYLEVYYYKDGSQRWTCLSGGGSLPDTLYPQNMLDVKNLIERLARG